jgi:hypothetical protein
LDQRRSLSGGADCPSLYKRHANSAAGEKRWKINGKKLIGVSCASTDCRRSLQSRRKPADLLCSAKK